ncbi:hypothetical protein ELI13_34575 [Rhizobium ruizarguesonis]|jgi:hypothetical protein|uniref:TfuA-like core domain-containing protein n=1 Tax=Rhizobium ruizarguesonis TaxID=2081791 RepID=A0ABY1WY83_9HYPH|nr:MULTISPECIES: TfuA-like protein [Rhizobium]TAU60413.1 hypothetical protein ELI46_35335 [Rhizobium ruizarguesonis]TAU60544.1 hypothetical protein ELI46_36260 [Rhizobium ruizarguesonis]TAU93554.1 hypothetical protein ELI37_34015 [Rhizobium leguminosarum]TAV19533.1 hypothetical protein ELI36_36510 [Rhizobium ruizarguesonis]TAV21678.1 hypothetical protein ELI33_35185 [Rhizobium ruizarguesonis]
MAVGINNKIAVFLGPSCTIEEARSILPEADYLPPAARGSIYGIINDGYRMIVLLDGLFYGRYSVWHKELLFALDCGIDVIGATSMGALRAAELDREGLTGVGQIYRWYRDGEIDGDDEVALLHQSSEGAYAALSIPLANLRWNLGLARKEGMIGEQQEARILRHAKAMCFQDRMMDVILSPLAEELDVSALQKWLETHGEDLKKRDCFEALRFAAIRIATLGSAQPSRLRAYETVHTLIGIEYFTHERLNAICAKSEGQAIPLSHYTKQVAVGDSRYRSYLRARACQRLINGWARELHLEITPEPIPAQWLPDRFDLAHRRATGLTLIDIAREGREAAFTAGVIGSLSTPASRGLVSDIDRQLAEAGFWARGAGAEIASLDGRLVYTLWHLGHEKGILPDDHEDADTAEAELHYLEWVYRAGLKHFGYNFDAAIEILLAHQSANRLEDIIGSRAAS